MTIPIAEIIELSALITSNHRENVGNFLLVSKYFY